MDQGHQNGASALIIKDCDAVHAGMGDGGQNLCGAATTLALGRRRPVDLFHPIGHLRHEGTKIRREVFDAANSGHARVWAAVKDHVKRILHAPVKS